MRALAGRDAVAMTTLGNRTPSPTAQLMIECARTHAQPSDAGRVHPDLVDARARCNVERLPVGVAESHISGLFGRADGAEMLALGRDDPYAAGSGLVEIALDV